MAGPFEGVRVVEVAAWTFVPGAGAIMADLGADVVKIEPPNGDPQRGLNLMRHIVGAPNPFVEVPNRGKRSVTLDLTTEGGREVLLKLVETADVFLTSYLPKLRQRMRIDVDDLRSVNPRLVYVRGTGWGSTGPMVDVGGYDAAAAWASGGAMHKLTEPGADSPAMQPAAFYDLQGSSSIAGAVAMALFRRERTGEGGVVDVSLLNTGMWTMSPDIVAAPYTGGELFRADRANAGNPIASYYRTSDDRWISLVCLQADRFWAELCRLIGRPDLAEDPRYVDMAARFKNRHECVAELDAIFGAKSMAEWKVALAGFTGVWAPARTFTEMYDDEQVAANHYLSEVTAGDGSTFRLVAPPYQFDEQPTSSGRPAPELGQHTEEVLLDLGMDWDEISAYRDSGALG
jgi:formyl-CoA transferase